MDLSNKPPKEQLAELNRFREYALRDANHYPNIIAYVVRCAGPASSLELRKWGADFLAEAFASPTLSPDRKQLLALKLLTTFKAYLDDSNQDAGVLRSVVQVLTNVYPYVFRHTISNPQDVATWETMKAVKKTLLQGLDSMPTSVQMVGIKFMQRMVQVQTAAVVEDKVNPAQNELSLSLVPPDHHMSAPILKAEADGMLDRVLNIFNNDTPPRDPLLITATLNCMAQLVEIRPVISNKIVMAVLRFDPFRILSLQPVTPVLRMKVKSIQRTTRIFLLQLSKRNPSHPLAAQIRSQWQLLSSVRLEDLENSRKRGAEISEATDSVKRQRLETVNSMPTEPPPAAPLPGPTPATITLAQMYTLTPERGAIGFDVRAIPLFRVVRILSRTGQVINPTLLNNAIGTVRNRWTAIKQRGLQITQPPPAMNQPLPASPQAPPAGQGQIPSGLNGTAETQDEDLLRLGPYKAQQPASMSESEVEECSKLVLSRVFGAVSNVDLTSREGAVANTGFGRLAKLNLSQKPRLVLLLRIMTRCVTGLDGSANLVKSEDRDAFSSADTIRQTLVDFVLQDFRKRLDLAISWLNEEYYNDLVQVKSGIDAHLNYPPWALKVLDGMTTYINARDKILIRFLSELPELDEPMLNQVKNLARDPERVSLAVQAIAYLAMYRKPVRGLCVKILEDLNNHNDGAKAMASKFLKTLRPDPAQVS